MDRESDAIAKVDTSVSSGTSIVLAEQQAQALTTLANSVAKLTDFVTNGGLTAVLNGYAKSQSVQAILSGLAAHDGRNALDARVLQQNALEIVKQVEAVFGKYSETIKADKEFDEWDKDK